MVVKWLEVYGGAVGSGNIRDVYFGGSPNSSVLGFPLTEPHAENKGRGIGFEQTDNGFTVFASLVGFVVTEQNRYYDWDNYFPYAGTYDWFFKLDFSKTGEGGPWHNLINQQVASHRGQPPAGLGKKWRETAIEARATMAIPEGATHIKISIHERDRTNFSRDPIFPISVLLSDFKPWAVRKSGDFKTLDRSSGRFTIRKSGQWVDKSKNQESDKGQVNKGQNRVRNQNQWKGQGKKGSN